MKALVIGQGGREQALALKLAESESTEKVFIAPGCEGISLNEKIENIDIAANSYMRLVEFAKREDVQITIVGPDQALADGVVNLFEAEGVNIFGPTRAAAQLESSKVYAKEVMKEAGIPTAEYRSFTDVNVANIYIDDHVDHMLVVKKDGLALGKGVMVCDSKDQAKAAVWQFLIEDNHDKIIIEERMQGKEFSFFAICDGEHFRTLGHACDYKRIRDNDEGPNTGGMGAYAPVDWLTPTMQKEIEQTIISPLLKYMKDKGTPFKGCLFVGLMVTNDGIKVVEFNVRFGDPETQAILPLVDEDFAQIIYQASTHGLKTTDPVKLKDQQCVHLVVASHGYPGTEGVAVRKGDEISLDSKLSETDFMFFAGVTKQDEKLFTNGGRVLGLSSLADSKLLARENVYKLVKGVHFEGMQFRTDIAQL